MRIITPPCRCGHSEWRHSAIFELCKGVIVERMPAATYAASTCHCASYSPDPAAPRIGWHERFVRVIRTVLS